MPYAFTEQGLAMLSSVLKSKTAIQVNILIMRAFVQMRVAIESYRELLLRIEEIENRLMEGDERYNEIYTLLQQLIVTNSHKPAPIGFHVHP